jgi:hypothetical protein
MAVDMFLKLNGVTGESKDKVHTKETDVLLAMGNLISRVAGLLGHSQGLFYQIGGDRKSIGVSNRFL